jgi:hypothetical protein
MASSVDDFCRCMICVRIQYAGTTQLTHRYTSCWDHDKDPRIDLAVAPGVYSSNASWLGRSPLVGLRKDPSPALRAPSPRCRGSRGKNTRRFRKAWSSRQVVALAPTGSGLG